MADKAHRLTDENWKKWKSGCLPFIPERKRKFKRLQTNTFPKLYRAERCSADRNRSKGELRFSTQSDPTDPEQSGATFFLLIYRSMNLLRPAWGEKTEKPKSKMDLEIFESKRSTANTKYISIDFS